MAVVKNAEYDKVALGFLNANFRPHEGQIPFLKAALDTPRGLGIKRVFCRAPRSWGKSTAACYIAWSKALLCPRSRIYLLAPMVKQVEEIYWAPEIIQTFCHFEGHNPFIKKIDEKQSRIILTNGSFIKVDGSDNYNAQRGWKPDLIIADEFADFDSRWLDVMSPNLVARNATLVIIGTPPPNPVLEDGSDHQYVKQDRYHKENHESGGTFWVHGNVFDNPIYKTDAGRKFLVDQESYYRQNDQYWVYEREYLANIVRGDVSLIFPNYDPIVHHVPHQDLLDRLAKEPQRYETVCIADPGTTTVFAVLFMVIDRYSSTVYLIDEIYETSQHQITLDLIIPEIMKKLSLYSFFPKFNLVADSAAAWFIAECAQRFQLYFSPTEKLVGDKKEGISLIKSLFELRHHFISSNCRRLSYELLNYKQDAQGRPVKRNDHLIDCFRYGLKFSGFYFVDKPQENSYPEHLRKPMRGYTTKTEVDPVLSDLSILTNLYFG